jgi:hypothetical protein
MAGRKNRLTPTSATVGLVVAVVALAGPYLLGIWLSGSIFGFRNPSLGRTLFGWVPEGVWLAVVAGYALRRALTQQGRRPAVAHRRR